VNDPDKRVLTNSQKQLLSMLLENYKIDSMVAAIQAKKKSSVDDKENSPKVLAVKNNTTGSLDTKCLPKPNRDFFGRSVKSDPVQTSKVPSPTIQKHSSHPVFFRYQEGFTNAVRRTVCVKDFL
jgi:hypothetical protein